MYVDLVQKDHFSISLVRSLKEDVGRSGPSLWIQAGGSQAKEAFEDSHVAQLCETFGGLAQEQHGIQHGQLGQAV
eukprot:Skav211457  [mRNA]  locus=scaffold379:150998:151836:- [translate_table: standard]